MTTKKTAIVMLSAAALLLGSGAGPAYGTLFWSDTFDNPALPDWDNNGDGTAAGGIVNTRDLSTAFPGNPKANTELDALWVQTRTTGGGSDGETATWNTAHTGPNGGLAYPGAGGTTYLYFWTYHAPTTSAAGHTGIGLSTDVTEASGANRGRARAIGFLHTTAGATGIGTMSAEYNNAAPPASTALNTGTYDLRIVFTSPDGTAMTITWQYKDVDDNTWLTLHSEITTTAAFPNRVINVGARVGHAQVYVGAVQYADVDAINFIPEPATLALLALGGVMMLRRSSAQVLRKRRETARS